MLASLPTTPTTRQSVKICRDKKDNKHNVLARHALSSGQDEKSEQKTGRKVVAGENFLPPGKKNPQIAPTKANEQTSKGVICGNLRRPRKRSAKLRTLPVGVY